MSGTSGDGAKGGESATATATGNLEVILLTGFPAFTAKRMARKLLEADPTCRIFLLARSKFRIAAQAFVDELAATSGSDGEGGVRERVTVLEGDVCDMDLGLAGAEYRALADEVTSIYHLAAMYYLGVKPEAARHVHVDGTRAMLELAGECRRLRRFTHFSTAGVSGTRSGVVLEEELDEGQRWRSATEETRFGAEKLVQAACRRLPITVLRPGEIVGDSRTGQIDLYNGLYNGRFDGPYLLMVLIITSPLDVHLPLPGRGAAPLHLVPIDFVIDAAYALSRDPRAVGRTFHLTDPSPFSARSVYELIAHRAERKAPRGVIPVTLARALARIGAPGLGMGAGLELGASARPALAFLESFNQMTLYNCRGTLALLEGTGVRCPPLDSYVDNLVRYVREVQAARKQKAEDEDHDPFE